MLQFAGSEEQRDVDLHCAERETRRAVVGLLLCRHCLKAAGTKLRALRNCLQKFRHEMETTARPMSEVDCDTLLPLLKKVAESVTTNLTMEAVRQEKGIPACVTSAKALNEWSRMRTALVELRDKIDAKRKRALQAIDNCLQARGLEPTEVSDKKRANFIAALKNKDERLPVSLDEQPREDGYDRDSIREADRKARHAIVTHADFAEAFDTMGRNLNSVQALLDDAWEAVSRSEQRLIRSATEKAYDSN